MKTKSIFIMKMSMVLLVSMVLIIIIGVSPAMGQEFKNGKSVWLLMPYTGEFWWNMLVTFLEERVKADGWNFNFATAEGSDTTQFEQITTYARQADILFIDPTSMEGVNEAVRLAEEQYHTPVVIYKDNITGKARVCAQYNDFEAGQAMAKEAVEWIKEKHGSTEGKTVIAVNGDLRQSGWKLRADGFRWIKENHPEINFIEITGGMTPEGWADVAEACIAGPGADAVAILAGSDGAYLIGVLQALEKYGKLYFADDPNHIFLASIDGKPSTLMWLRNGYMDLVYSQTPDSIAAALWQVAKEYILKDASYQYPPYQLPEIPLPLEVKQPVGCYWGGNDLVMKIETVDYSLVPMGTTPAPRVDRFNVNTWELWGNKIIKVLGPDLDPIPVYSAKGNQPDWSKELINEFNTWLEKE